MEQDEQIEKLESDVLSLSQSLNRHLEIYAANGKEMARLADNVETHGKKVDEMYVLFTKGSGVKDTFVIAFKLFVATGSVAGAWLLIKQIIPH